MVGAIRTTVVLVLVALATLLMGPIVWIGVRTGLFKGRRMLRSWHRIAAAALGLRIHKAGELAGQRPLLVVSNHISWTDIIVLGAHADVSFIARADMSGWPVVGWLARLQRTLFIEREKKGKSGEQAGAVARRMREGDAMVLFAEGTTGDGNRVMPFKSTLFGAAGMMLAADGTQTVWVQPAAIAYTRLHGMPMGRRFRPLAAWIGDQDMASHARGLLAHSAIDVELRFGAPIPFSKASRRKETARRAESDVRAMLHSALSDPAQ